MNALDQNALRAIQAWASKRIEAHERRQRMQPLWDALSRNLGIPSSAKEIIDQTSKKAEDSLISLERSLADFPARIAAEDERREKVLASARLKTAALRRLLEDVS